MGFINFLLRHYKLIQQAEVQSLSSVCTHSAKVQNSSLFIALKGRQTDGHKHLKQAVRQGAGALLVEKTELVPSEFKGLALKYEGDVHLDRILNEFYNFPSEKLFTVGVTGTNGKTSFCYLLEHIFKHCGWPTGVMGTIDQHFEKKQWPSSLTTPEPAGLFARLKDFVQLGARAAALEVSSHAIDQKRIAGLDFNALVFTNLSPDHLDYHKDMESYFQAKKQLFLQAQNKHVFALVNQDDEYGRRLKKETAITCWTYGQDSQADFCFKIKKSSRDSTVFELKSSSGVQEFHLPLAGRHNVYNAVSALACALQTGFKAESCAEALKTFPGVPGRLETVKGDKTPDFEVLVDYAHSPNALAVVLPALKNRAGKVILVLGCGGDRDKDKRAQMADVSLQFADHVFWTTDNPRFEKPEQIVQGALGHLSEKQKEKITLEPDRKTAIRKAIQSAEKGDIVLIAGKGHEPFQIVKDQKIPFSDRTAALQCLKELS